ncbi:MAG: disulfide reductase [Syntrophomonadaceae bacterium]|nr:disulfide reductase [Syntrophomonadaceae bacterium]
MRLAYYPGCSLNATAVEYGVSTRRVAEMLGVELEEIADWNCCGATSAHSTNWLLSLALPARNLALAEQEGLDVLAPCAACYNRFRATEFLVREDVGVRQQVEEAIAMEYHAQNQTLSILEWLVGHVGLDAIKKKVTQPLSGMKPACYYGCLLVRPVEYTGFDDPEYPQSLDNIMKVLGAQPVNWSHQTECCGASLSTTRPEVGLRMSYEILKRAREAGADSIVTVCPLCQMNLDMRQAQIEKRFGVRFDLPIYYITEMVGVACGISLQEMGIHRHFVEAVYHLTHLSQAEEEVAKEKAASEPQAGGLSKGAVKLSTRIFADDSDQANQLAEILTREPERIKKIAKIMAEDKDKARKVAEAMIKKEAKKAGEAAKPKSVGTEDAAGGPSKGALKFSSRLFENDEAKARQLAEILTRDTNKLKKLAQIMAQDKDKAIKVGEAFIKKEAKTKGEEVTGQ